MSTTIQVKRGLAAAVAAVTPASGEPVWETDTKKLKMGDGSTAGGNAVQMAGTDDITILFNTFHCPAPGTDWTPQKEGVALGANLTAKKFWIPLTGLLIGDIIKSFKILGDVHEEAGDTVTFDAKIYKVNKADPLTTTDLTNGAITQVTADGNFDSAADNDDETVATDQQYGIECAGTTSNVSTNEKIIVIGVELLVTRTRT